MTSPLAGKPLRYLIGADSAGAGQDGEITVVPYGDPPVRHGISIGYCNLFDERVSYDKDGNAGEYGPYLPQTDTAGDYDEGVIDPHGPGWLKNLNEQFARRRDQQFEYIEIDNADAYLIDDVMGAVSLAYGYGLKVIAKNPLLVNVVSSRAYVAHPNIFGVIVEKGAGDPRDMDMLRRDVGKPDIPVWFVAFGKGRAWASDTAKRAANFRNMGVTYSSRGEYENSQDILLPKVIGVHA